jgi:hypothetical protein
LFSDYLKTNEHYKQERKTILQDEGSQRVLKEMYINSFLFSKLYDKKIIEKRPFPWFRKKRETKYLAKPITKYLDILENELGLKVRFVPMPGYKFNSEKIMFEKEK